MHKFSVLAESKIYPQRIPPSIPHFENASGMQTEGYETYYSYVLSESKKLKLHLTCKVSNNITGEPNFVKFMNGGVFCTTKNVISSRATTIHSACFVWKILLSPDCPPILPLPHSCFPPTVQVKDFRLRLPTLWAPDFLPTLTSSPYSSSALMWTATLVSGGLQLCKPLM